MRSPGTFRVVATVVVIGLCAVVASGCSGGNESDTSATPAGEQGTVQAHRGGRLVYGIEADPNGLDPTRNAWDGAGIMLANALYDPLAAYDNQSKPQPYLAESFSHSPDYKSWTIKLRPGIKFSDGAALDADALRTFVERLKASPFVGGAAQMVGTVSVVDPLTVSLAMTAAWASFPALLTGQGGYVVAPSQLNDPDGTKVPRGTGPFRLRDWQQDKRFSLVRNPDYWRSGLPYLDGVDFEVVGEGEQRVKMLERGDLDVTNLSFPSDIQSLQRLIQTQQASSLPEHQRLKVERDTSPTDVYAILFNTWKPPLDDVRIRRAIAYATDIKALAAANNWPAEKLAQGPFPPDSPYFVSSNYPTYDLSKARELVNQYLKDQRGRTREVRFKLAGAVETQLLQQLTEMWAKAGIKVDIEFVEWKQKVRRAAVGNIDAETIRYFAAIDPDVLWHFFVSSTIAEKGTPKVSLNFTHYADKAIDDGFNQGRASDDPAVRKAAYGKVQQSLAANLPYLWLMRADSVIATTGRVRDARNMTLPDDQPALPFTTGTHRLTQTWIEE